MKKLIKTFSKIGEMIVDRVEAGIRDSVISHGNVDSMVVSCFPSEPPVKG